MGLDGLISSSPAWPTSRPAPAWARRAASPPRCSRRCTRSRRTCIHPHELAEQACHIEIDCLKRAHRQAGPVHRRLRRHHLLHASTRTAGRGLARCAICQETLYNLEDNLLLFFTGYSRSASDDPQGPGRRAAAARRPGDARQPALHQGARPARASTALEAGDLERFAELMDVHWEHKKKRSGGMSNDQIDEWYDPRHATTAPSAAS